MRVLVTGATGFIGSRVVRELASHGHDAFALARPGASHRRLIDVRDQIRMVEGDLDEDSTTERLIADVRPDAIVHLAWYAEPGKYLHDVGKNLASLRASTRLLEGSLRNGCRRVVLAGTCLENPHDQSPTVYEASKRAMHALSQGFGDAGVSIACGHVYHVLGPGEDERRVVPCVIRSLIRGESIPTTDGKQRRDYLHVDDVAAAFCRLAETSFIGGIDICSGSITTLCDVFELIGTEMDRRSLIHVGALGPGGNESEPSPGDPEPLHELGWVPRYNLHEAVVESINWWRNEEAGS